MCVVSLVRTGLLLLMLIGGGCSPVPPSPRQAAVPELAAPAQAPAESADRRVRLQVEKFLAADELELAFKAVHEAKGAKIAETLLAELSVEVGNRLLSKAEQAGRTNHFELAGRLYRMALKVLPENPALQSDLALSRAEINGRLLQCADALMKKGLMAYRAGKLVAAVDTWKKIGQFYPDHPPSEVAIVTAEQQLKNLERLEGDKPR